MDSSLTLNALYRYLVRASTNSARSENQLSQIANTSKTHKSPNDCSILIADNSHGYVYVQNLGGYVPVKTQLEGDRDRYLRVEDASPILPDPNTPIIDDGISYSTTLCNALRLRGYDVDTASNGVEAANMIKRGDWDLIIMGSQIKANAEDQPNQEEAKRFLEYISKYKTDLAVILTAIPKTIEPLHKDINQILREHEIPVLEKPYEIPKATNGNNNYNQLLSMVRRELGIRTK
jgi:CheY-like chemotaxis protein